MEIANLKKSKCVRCDYQVAHSQPNCPNCGVWQPWGDRAVALLRRTRLERFRAEEQKAELALLKLRYSDESRTGGEGLRYRVLRWLHLQSISNGRQVALASILTCLVTLGASWLFFGQQPAARANRTASTRVSARAAQSISEPSAKCYDGTFSYAASRSGMCAGHGGVKYFFTDR